VKNARTLNLADSNATRAGVLGKKGIGLVMIEIGKWDKLAGAIARILRPAERGSAS
jgi:hypothetical protein